MGSLRVGNGFKIGVIGGGPSGSFFAIHALRLAARMSVKLSVTIFEMKDFSDRGAKGCNRCAGVIAENLVNKLKKIDITIPENVIQTRVKGYSFWVHGRSGTIERGGDGGIITVYRGGGPRHADSRYQKRSFDGFLLGEAVSRGAVVKSEFVYGVDLVATAESRVRVFYGAGAFDEFDFIIGAFGLNMGANHQVQGFSSHYRSPRKWHAFQFEVPLKTFHRAEHFREKINVFFIKPKGIKFLAVTPKGEYLTVSGIGEKVIIRDFKETIKNSELLNFTPEQWETTCLCNPAINSSFGRGIVGKRYLIVGDAACSRWLKNGIDSAFVTAGFAAEALFTTGVSTIRLKIFYILRCSLFFRADNIFGRLMLRFHDHIMRNRVLSLSYLNLLEKEHLYQKGRKRRLSRVLWHLYTGDRQYFDIFLRSLDPVLQFQLLQETILTYVKKYRRR